MRAAGTRTRPKKTQAPAESRLERLQKIIATAGITSRRKAEELITQGRVTVNGKEITELGAKADPLQDRIEVDGKRISVKGPKVYILLYKPKGYISSVSDEHGRPVVTNLVSRLRLRVYPVGRLDYDAEGVLLLTNDGDLSNRLIHPTFQVPKKYLVKVKDAPAREKLDKLEKGIRLEDGKTLPAKAKFVRATQENSWIELTVFEGRNHLVKRMCMAIGHPVQKLKRVEFAGLRLGTLKPGEFRLLTEDEVAELKGMKGE
ncbi:MAG: pseudouridine synthase [Deltaproteobacteria bacterium GWC2_55_46]|nr:MAG: pseudouridine synthase [Deltaproteobacteria bacterium GWA2_55_82]OGQ64852.1 MAG: pseudouridine synthase [Deltaproteobacteria bacterium RIFCSPLOWO2_02_FULL_55_12]OIJ73918.1 MAG: pseudouridine synthase [Deltaproteobacteria bacterium GWC2_55_46]